MLLPAGAAPALRASGCAGDRGALLLVPAPLLGGIAPRLHRCATALLLQLFFGVLLCVGGKGERNGKEKEGKRAGV